MDRGDPPVLSDSEDFLDPSQASLLWTRLHSLDRQLWSQTRSLETTRAEAASEAARAVTLASFIQEIRIELDQIRRLLNSLQSRLQRCEQSLQLDFLD